MRNAENSSYRYIHEYLPKTELLFRVITIDEFERLLTGDQTESEGV